VGSQLEVLPYRKSTQNAWARLPHDTSVTSPPVSASWPPSEINRFVRHIGQIDPYPDHQASRFERYQNYLTDTVGDAATRVEALKTFLNDLKAKKLTEINLGAGLRVRRKGR